MAALGAIQKPRRQQRVGRWSKICHFCPRLLHKKCPRGVGGWFKKTKIMSTWLLNAPLVFVIVREAAFMDLLMFSMIILVGKLLDLYLK